MQPQDASTRATERTSPIQLTLYVAGNSQRAMTAMSDLRRLTEERRHLELTLDVVDVVQNRERARLANVLVTPTLVAQRAGGERRVLGRFDDVNTVVDALELERS